MKQGLLFSIMLFFMNIQSPLQTLFKVITFSVTCKINRFYFYSLTEFSCNTKLTFLPTASFFYDNHSLSKFWTKKLFNLLMKLLDRNKFIYHIRTRLKTQKWLAIQEKLASVKNTLTVELLTVYLFQEELTSGLGLNQRFSKEKSD